MRLPETITDARKSGLRTRCMGPRGILPSLFPSLASSYGTHSTMILRLDRADLGASPRCAKIDHAVALVALDHKSPN